MKLRRMLLIFIFFLATINSYAKESDLLGSWVKEGISNADGVPISIFTIDIFHIDNNIVGEYCYISNYGRKDDCNNKFLGKKLSKNLYQISFDSSFGGKDGIAELYFIDKKLQWLVKKTPQFGNYSIPMKSLLNLEKTGQKPIEISVSKSFIFKNPNIKEKTKSYLIKGDNIVIDEINDGWIKIKYKNKILGWIKEEDIL